MAAILPEWPKAQPLVVGDPVACVVYLTTTADITGWTWAAAIRSYPGGPVVTRFDVESNPTDKSLTLRLTEAESRKLRPGYAFDLRQLTPVDWTWLQVESLNVVPSYSDEGV